MAYADSSGSVNMSGNWEKILGLAREKPELMKRLETIWKNAPGLRIRSTCHMYIEQQPWMDYTKDMERATAAFKGLIDEARRLSAHSPDPVLQHDIHTSLEKLESDWSYAKIEFASKMVSSLSSEKMLLESCTPDPDDRHADPHESNLAEDNHDLLKEIRGVCDDMVMQNLEVDQLQKKQAQCLVMHNEWTEQKGVLNEQLARATTDAERQQIHKTIEVKNKEYIDKATQLFNSRQLSVKAHRTLVEEKIERLCQMAWNDVLQWKNQLKLAATCITKPQSNAVEVLERLCSEVAKLLLKVMQQNKRLQAIVKDLDFNGRDDSKEVLKSLRQRLEMLMENHLHTVFVVEKCPNIIRVVTAKSQSEIPLHVRLLGGDALEISHNLPEVTTFMYRDSDLQDFPNIEPKKMVCNVINGKKYMEQNSHSSQIYVVFTSVSLQKVQTSHRGQDKLVSELMYAIVVTTNIRVGDTTYTPKAMSLPIIIVSHVSQECQAKGFLLWDAAFSKPDKERKPFVNPPQVEWQNIAHVLNAYFKGHTGRGITPQQLDYLASILFKDRKKVINSQHRVVTKALIFKDSLYKKDQKSFSFWKWFNACMNLVKEKVKREWDGLNGVQVIEGFMSKQTAERVLLGCEVGTFLLRFSERNIEDSNKGHPCGCLTIAVAQICPDTGEKKIFHVKDHLSAEDIHKYTLPSILNALTVTADDGKPQQLCKMLYPNHPFGEVFHDSIKELSSNEDGYLKCIRRIEIFLSDSQRLHHNSSLPAQSPLSSVMSPQYPSTVLSDDGTGMGSAQNYGPTPARVARVSPFDHPSKVRRGADGSASSVSVVSPMSPSPAVVPSHQQMQQQQQPQQQQQFYNMVSSPYSGTSHSDMFTITTEVSHVNNVVELGDHRTLATVMPSPSPSQSYSMSQQSILSPAQSVLSPAPSPHVPVTVEDMFRSDHDMAAAAAAAVAGLGAGGDLPNLDLESLQLDAEPQAHSAANYFNGDLEIPLEIDEH